MKSSLNKLLTAQAVALGFAILGSLHGAAVAAEAKVSIPATASGIWQAIDDQVAQLTSAIRNGQLDTVHAHAFAIRDLAAALPARSAALPADRLAQVKANEKFIATLAERLDSTGDAHDKAGTESNFDKLKRVLATMRKSYAAEPGTGK